MRTNQAQRAFDVHPLNVKRLLHILSLPDAVYRGSYSCFDTAFFKGSLLAYKQAVQQHGEHAASQSAK